MIYEIENLKQIYDGRTVLDIEHLSVAEGEILALVGPSGAGKSTLLRLLNFLEAPRPARCAMPARWCRGPPPLEMRRQVTTVFQRPSCSAPACATMWPTDCACAASTSTAG